MKKMEEAELSRTLSLGVRSIGTMGRAIREAEGASYQHHVTPTAYGNSAYTFVGLRLPKSFATRTRN